MSRENGKSKERKGEENEEGGGSGFGVVDRLNTYIVVLHKYQMICTSQGHICKVNVIYVLI